MKSISKRSLCVLICLLLTIPFVLASCNGGDDNSSATSSVSQGTESGFSNDHGGYNAKDDVYFVNMDKAPSDKTEFNVLVYDNTAQDTYFSEEVGVGKYTTTDEAITNAVTNRNNMIEEKYGVKIVAVYAKDVGADLQNDVLSSGGAYDAAMPFLPTCAKFAQEGSLYDLSSEDFSQYLDLSMPWWDNNATKSLSINNKVYFTTGDISLMQKIVSLAVTFNKKMMKDYWSDVNVYDLVRNGEWTLDKMIELSKKVTSDTNGDGTMTYKDTWGVSSSYGDSQFFYLASGENLVTKDASDIPVIAIGSERSITVAQKALTKLQEQGTWCVNCQDFGSGVSNIWQESLNVFGENRALFRTTAFSAIKKLRNYTDGDDYGIIPFPKYDTEQESYFTPCSATLAYGVVIPTSAPDPTFSAFMLEVMGCQAKNYITDAYYTTVLKSRDLGADPDSEEMLDKFIFNNVVYDIGLIYNFGGVSSMFNTMMSEKSVDIASKLESIKPTIQTAIDDAVAAYSD